MPPTSRCCSARWPGSICGGARAARCASPRSCPAARCPTPASHGRCAGVAHLLGFADEALPRIADWTRDFVACLSPLSTAAQLRAASEAAAALMARFEALVAAPAGARRAACWRRCARRRRPIARAPCWPTWSACCRRPARPRPACWATAWWRWRASRGCADAIARARGTAMRPGAGSGAPRSLGPEHAPLRRRADRRRGHRSSPPGDAVLLVLGAANRDPALNPQPETFELDARRAPTCWASATARMPAPARRWPARSRRRRFRRCWRAALDIDALRERGWDYRPSVNARIPVFR